MFGPCSQVSDTHIEESRNVLQCSGSASIERVLVCEFDSDTCNPAKVSIFENDDQIQVVQCGKQYM